MSYNKAYYEQNKEKWLEYQRGDDYKAHRAIYRKTPEYKQRQKELALGIKKEVLSHYSDSSPPKCSLCVEERLHALTIDHINNDGNVQRRERGYLWGGVDFYRWLKKQGYPKGYQTLCMNCQFVKREEQKDG